MFSNERENGGSTDGFTDGFLGAMNDEGEEEVGLPTIEEEFLSPGTYQNIVLEDACIDEPLPTTERVYLPREEEWSYETADFHGSYEESARAAAKRHAGSEFADDAVAGDNANGFTAVAATESTLGYDDDEELAAILGSVTSSDSTGLVSVDDDTGYGSSGISSATAYDGGDGLGDSSSVASDEAFESVEDKSEDFDDLENILAGINSGGSDSDEEEEQQPVALETNFRITQEDEELMQGFDIDQILSFGIDSNASDVHINPERRIAFRINGSIVKSPRFDVIPGEVTRRIQQKIVTNVADDIFLENWELDTSYTIRSGPHRGRRVRVSVTKTFEEIAMVMRIISEIIPQPHELGIEDELLEWSELPSGLILMNGPTGTGKSTTLASMVQNIQMRLDGVIVTIEKPVEYIYPDQGLAMVYQREVGRDTLSFGAALNSAMRMDPDVLLIGETRNAVEMDAALEAADTGHLSLSTTHANSAAEAVNRIKRMFKGGEERRQAMESLSTVARGFAAQVLCKTTDGKGRFAVREILSIDASVAEMIKQGDNRAVRKLQEERGITLDHGLVKAALEGRCTVQEARSKSPNPRYFDALFAERKKFL